MMKKLFLFPLFIGNIAFAQVTDTGNNVGIGVTTPNSQLTVGSNFGANVSGSGGGNAVFGSNMAVISGGLNHNKLVTPSGHNANYGYSGMRSSWGKLYFYTNSGNTTAGEVITPTTRMFINTSGDIGIGTTSPYEKLDVNGLIRIPAANNQDNNSPGIIAQSNDDFLYDSQYINNYAFGFHGFQDGSTTHTEPMNTYMSGYFGVDFFTSGLNRMRISRDGIVSIGTVNRQVGYKLAVNGNIKAKEIKVETGWSDFVFENNYNLPSLKEVEQHIKEKGHLKDIPSAKEVKENGIFLGEMDSKLLQKIEELTLYTIEQQKEIEDQNDNIETQSNKIEQLEKENKVLKSLLERVTKLEEKIKP